MEVLIGFVLFCVAVGAYYGKRAPDDAEYEVDPAKRGQMQLATGVFMTVFTAVVIVGILLLLFAVGVGMGAL
jgi:hypothetical protein